MEKILEAYIAEEAQKHILKYNQYHNSLHREYKRVKKRLNDDRKKEIKKPFYWEKDKKFNPFYVYSNRKAIAKAITKKIKNGTYKPNNPTYFEKEKKGGGKRKITIYQIPDAAVSNYFYKRMLSKNKHRFSSFSYAYRDDRNVHFAVQDIALELNGTSRLFVAEFDFSKFFDTINHKFLFDQLNENGFLVTNEEKNIINSFLEKEEEGIPQGTSLSLFLANVTCWSLDRKLEEEGLRFARYADDTLIWSKDYNKIVKAFDIIDDFSKQAKVKINYAKSEGISLLAHKECPAEFYKTKDYVEFLGYKITSEQISIKDESVLKIKDRIASILYQNLIYPVKSKKIKEIPLKYDRDYLVAISQIRKYLYGDLTDEKIEKYVKGRYKKVNFKGIMSFYLLLTDEEQLKELDKWLCKAILNTLRFKKNNIESNNEVNLNKFPYNMTYQNFIEISSKEKINKKSLYKIPSFLKIKKAVEKGIKEEGIEKVMNPRVNEYNYNEL